MVSGKNIPVLAAQPQPRYYFASANILTLNFCAMVKIAATRSVSVLAANSSNAFTAGAVLRRFGPRWGRVESFPMDTIVG